PYDIALLCFGLPLALVPFGFYRTLRREGLAFMGPLSAVLAFITYAWLQRGSLGLTRHFVAVVPLYATAAAHGMMVIAEFLERRLHEPGRALGIAAFVTLSTGSSLLTFDLMRDWMNDWSEKQRSIFTDRYAIAGYLKTLPPNARIFCDEPSLEVFSGLSYKRFLRPYIGNDDASVARVKAVAVAEGEVYVATWSSKLPKLVAAGALVFRPPGSPPKLEDGGLAVVRLTR
ncbi:MAG: hypothetical protein JNL79_13865, partial [Myxococcales bacterium]|nr:hypothetical protein [Myxococcales bacterium]